MTSTTTNDISSTPIDPNKEDVVASIRVLLDHIDSFLHAPNADVDAFLENIGEMETIFWLIVNVPSQHPLLSRALTRIFSGPTGLSRLLSPQLIPIFTAGLQHSYQHVRTMTLQQLINMSNTEQGSQYLLSSSLYPLLLSLLHDPELSVVSLASDLIQKLATRGDETIQQFFAPEIQQQIIKQNIDTSKTSALYCLRALSLCTSIALTSPHAYTAFLHAGIMDQMMKSLEDRDVLIQLNIMELIGKLGSTPLGLATLTERDIGTCILRIINVAKQTMLTVGGCKLFGTLANASKQHNSHTWYQSDAIREFLAIQISDENDNDVVKAEAISASCEFGASPEGLLWLAKPVSIPSLHTRENPTGSTLMSIPAYVISTSELLQMTTLHGLVNVLEHKYESDSASHPTARTLQQQAFGAIATYRGGGHSSLGVLRYYLSTPFADLRLACFRVIAAIARHLWGLMSIFHEAGLIEFLLDRSTEVVFGKMGLEMKYQIVVNLVENVAFQQEMNTMTPMIKKDLLEYRAKGPYYQQRVALVEAPLTKGAE